MYKGIRNNQTYFGFGSSNIICISGLRYPGTLLKNYTVNFPHTNTFCVTVFTHKDNESKESLPLIETPSCLLMV